ncbi:unnamed protein product [Rhizophagus irregularis]|uniref:Uncharacterized protein n=1 Tax=Rhizophagus irregularis TaxID=588596 RepID=A0A2I1G181_9GLOM|nr:hypothetical protein RhiirA4_538772 [Rhizophagus irregularis]CAB4432866.1 unnamed protein product [Rhizophagus irregularis]
MNHFVLRLLQFRNCLGTRKIYHHNNFQPYFLTLTMNYFFSSNTKSVPSNICYHIEGFINCSYFSAAVELGYKLKDPSFNKNADTRIQVSVDAHKKETWSDKIKDLHSLIPKSKNHTSSPLIYEGCSPGKYEFIGGYSEFVKLVKARHKLNIQNDIKEGGRECVGDVCKI